MAQQRLSPERRPPSERRPWWWDALAAGAFFSQALLVGKLATRVAGPIAGLFVFSLSAGLGWLYARAAWHGLIRDRDGR